MPSALSNIVLSYICKYILVSCRHDKKYNKIQDILVSLCSGYRIEKCKINARPSLEIDSTCINKFKPQWWRSPLLLCFNCSYWAHWKYRTQRNIRLSHQPPQTTLVHTPFLSTCWKLCLSSCYVHAHASFGTVLLWENARPHFVSNAIVITYHHRHPFESFACCSCSRSTVLQATPFMAQRFTLTTFIVQGPSSKSPGRIMHYPKSSTTCTDTLHNMLLFLSI